jgi:hypothetical protein
MRKAKELEKVDGNERSVAMKQKRAAIQQAPTKNVEK